MADGIALYLASRGFPATTLSIEVRSGHGRQGARPFPRKLLQPSLCGKLLLLGTLRGLHKAVRDAQVPERAELASLCHITCVDS